MPAGRCAVPVELLAPRTYFTVKTQTLEDESVDCNLCVGPRVGYPFAPPNRGVTRPYGRRLGLSGEHAFFTVKFRARSISAVDGAVRRTAHMLMVKMEELFVSDIFHSENERPGATDFHCENLSVRCRGI